MAVNHYENWKTKEIQQKTHAEDYCSWHSADCFSVQNREILLSLKEQ